MKPQVCSIHKENKGQKSCIGCGCYYNEESGIHGLKTNKFADPFLIDSLGFLKSLEQRVANFMTMDELPKVNPLVSEIMKQLAEEFKLSLTTLAKGQYIFYHLLKEHPQFHDQQLRYGAVCLYLAAKMTEHLSGIPNVGAFGHRAYKVFEKSEYAKLEEEVFGSLPSTIFEAVYFTEFLEYYQVKGLVLSHEGFRQRIIEELEDRAKAISINYISSGQFLKHSQKKLAAFILHQVRQQAKVSEVWSQHIELYTKLGTLDIYNILKDFRKRVVSGVPNHKRLDLKHSASNSKNASNTSLSTIASMSSKATAPQSPAIIKINNLLRSASVKSKLLAKPYRGIIFA